MEKKVIYYQDRKGRKPAKEFINNLESKTKGKVLARIQFLEQHWFEARRPIIDKIDKDLYEIRVIFSGNQVRVIYAYMFKEYIVLLHGIIKKTDKIPENDILRARKRMIDFQLQFNEGRIQLRK
jgi:phage-related protein